MPVAPPSPDVDRLVAESQSGSAISSVQRSLGRSHRAGTLARAGRAGSRNGRDGQGDPLEVPWPSGRHHPELADAGQALTGAGGSRSLVERRSRPLALLEAGRVGPALLHVITIDSAATNNPFDVWDYCTQGFVTKPGSTPSAWPTWPTTLRTGQRSPLGEAADWSAQSESSRVAASSKS